MPRDEVQLSNAPPLPPHCFEISVGQQVFMCVCGLQAGSIMALITMWYRLEV